MSGIAGIIHFDGKPAELESIQEMTSAMSFRGPDGINHWVKGSVAMGQCMLCTTPESLEENQPLINEDESLVLVMDGRVDNWEELRKKLLAKGAILRNRSDAELVLRSYEIWGEACIAHIDGDFALVVWDAKDQIAFCARDRVGNKPFYYYRDNTTLVFSSEVHTILALPWVNQKLNQGMVAEFLAWEFYSRDETFWHGITKLLAAHHMKVSSSRLTVQQYWLPTSSHALTYTKDEEFIEHYRELFTDIVRRMSRSNKTLACEVSGGLDSSAIFCMAEHLRRSGKLAAPGIEGYTLAFTDNSDANELEYARAVGKYLDLHIHEVPPSSFPKSWFLEKAHKYKNFPSYPNYTMFIDLQKKASSQSNVLLTGQGGDEWLEGSRLYYAEELAQRQWHTLYTCFKEDYKAFGTIQALKWISRFGLFPLLPKQTQKTIRHSVNVIRGNQKQNAYWLSANMRTLLEEQKRKSAFPVRSKSLSIGQNYLIERLENAFSDQSINMVGSISARSQIEQRHPFRSHKLIEYAFSVPQRQCLRGDRSKYTHTRALKGFMPEEILDRKDKAEFSLTFQPHLNQMEMFFIDQVPKKCSDWISQEGIEQLYIAYQTPPYVGRPLWVLWSILGCYNIRK